MYRIAVGTVLGVALGSLLCTGAQAQRILYLTKSAGFEHEAVKRMDGKPAFSEEVLKQLADENGADITITKDASLINADNLKNYDLVIFYTTGDLTQPSADGRDEPPMGPGGLQALTDWIKAGGGFLGYHAATDTWGTPEGQPPTPYTQLIGGTFAGHGAQFEGTVVAVDPDHPTMQSLPKEWKITEEWYTFRSLDKDNMHVLAVLEAGPERAKQEMYNTPAYPIIWCKTLGNGRIYYNGLGHREDVWRDPVFQASIVDAAEWALGDPEADAEPNFDKAVPKEIPAAKEETAPQNP